MRKKLSIFIALVSVLFFQLVASSAQKDNAVMLQSLKKIGLGELHISKYESNKINEYDSSIFDDQPILLVANKQSNTLSYINPKTFKIIKTIPTGPNPHEITVTPDQRFAYLSSYEPPGNTISVIDLLTRKQIKQINTGKYGRIHGAAMALDGKHAYFTAGQSGFVVEIDTKTNEIARAIPTHGKISHMVYLSPDGEYLWVANQTAVPLRLLTLPPINQ